jgi:hypothetical protein
MQVGSERIQLPSSPEEIEFAISLEIASKIENPAYIHANDCELSWEDGRVQRFMIIQPPVPSNTANGLVLILQGKLRHD